MVREDAHPPFLDTGFNGFTHRFPLILAPFVSPCVFCVATFLLSFSYFKASLQYTFMKCFQARAGQSMFMSKLCVRISELFRSIFYTSSHFRRGKARYVQFSEFPSRKFRNLGASLMTASGAANHPI